MALHIHGRVSLLCQTKSSSFPSSILPAAAPLRGPSKSARVSPPFKLCSPLRVRCAAGSKLGSEVHSSISIPAESDELPPLLESLAIPGLPPLQESMYADEALAFIRKRLPSNWPSELEPIFHVSVSFMSFNHPATVSTDRLAAVSTVCAFSIILDDVLLETPNALLAEKIGVDSNILGSPHSIREYIHSLIALLRQDQPPQNPTPIQEMAWKLGCDLRELSNPEWFKVYSDSLLAFYLACLESTCADLVGDRTSMTDLESFIQMRVPTAGGGWNNLCVEFCKNAFLPTEIRQQPTVQQLSMAAWAWGSHINDIFSYSKEQDDLHSPNLIKALMEIEGLSLPQAAWRAVNMTNSLAREIMELETQLLARAEEPGTPALCRYVGGVKESMSGNLYWHSLVKRYRHPNAPFPELRDVNVSFFPKAERKFQFVQ